jgi:phage-related baseplate assembly protein
MEIEFRKYIENLCPDNITFRISQPIIVPMNVTATVYCQPGVDLEAAKNYLTNKIVNAFRPKRGSLGYSVYRHDINKLLSDSAVKVDYVKIQDPSADQTISKQSYIKLGNVNITTAYTTRADLKKT